MSGWSNQPVAAALVIIESVSGSGLFVYNGVPGPGTLIASIASGPGTDPFGNPVKAGIVSYTYLGSQVIELFNGQVSVFDTNFTTTPGGFGISLAGAGGQAVFVNSGKVLAGETSGNLGITSSGFGSGGIPVMSFNGIIQATAAASGGQLLVITNTATPSNSNVEIICNAAGDNALGIMVAGDAFNRIKVNTLGLLAGPGTLTQDVRFTRDASGVWIADNILTNVSGSAETWHSLGTLAGATVNKGRYRFLPTGEVKVEIDVTFGAATAVPITFSNTLPAAYQPPGSVDVRSPAAQTNGSGGIARFFIGSVGGGSAGQVQIAAFGTVVGTYSAYFSYSVL